MEPVDLDPPPEGWELRIYAKDQPELYHPLPAYFRRGPKGQVVTRWRPSAEELAALFAGDDLCLEIWTFNNRLQPVKLGVWSDVAACVDGGIDEPAAE